MNYKVVNFKERPDLYELQEEICGKAFPVFLYHSEVAANYWTKMKFPESGEYVVDGALCPVVIDRENNLGIYIEPNVWISYGI